VLQCVAVCCSVLQCVAVYCSVLQCIAVCCTCAWVELHTAYISHVAHMQVSHMTMSCRTYVNVSAKAHAYVRFDHLHMSDMTTYICAI